MYVSAIGHLDSTSWRLLPTGHCALHMSGPSQLYGGNYHGEGSVERGPRDLGMGMIYDVFMICLWYIDDVLMICLWCIDDIFIQETLWFTGNDPTISLIYDVVMMFIFANLGFSRWLYMCVFQQICFLLFEVVIHVYNCVPFFGGGVINVNVYK